MDENIALAQPLGANVPADDCMNDDLVDKLRMLNYEIDFCKNFNSNQAYRPLSRVYFMSEAENNNAQFFYFTSLSSWLMELCGNKNFPLPDQFADPTATLSNLVQELKNVDIPQKDVAPNKIRPGWGEAILSVLIMLADRALLNRRFSFHSIQYPTKKSDSTVTDEKEHGDEASQQHGDRDEIEDRVGDIARSDDDEEGGEGGEGGEEEMFTGIYGNRQAQRVEATKPQVTAEAWQMEVERVAPMLQSAVGLEVRDWRARVEGAVTLMRAVDSMYPDVRAMLERVGDDIDKTLDRIRKREQTLGSQFVEQVEEYRGKLRRLNTLQDKFNSVSTKVSGFSSELNNVTATLEDVKAKIAEYEEKSSDTTPLVRIKEAVAQVRAEIKAFSLRIGLLQHNVLHIALRHQKEKKKRQAQGIAAAGNIDRYQSSSSNSPGNNDNNSQSVSDRSMTGGAELDFSGYA